MFNGGKGNKMLDSLLFHLMLIGALGIGSQWLAWRFHLPAIVIMSVAGLLAGPAFGLINPKEDFDTMFKPIISMAVAIILFEGSLNLDVREIRGIGGPILRIISIGAVLAWIFGSIAAHLVADLSWAVSFVIGGLFIVTGPTVIIPLLRQAKLKPKPAKILKWEGIIVDPFGAVLAVFAYEFIKILTEKTGNAMDLVWFILASLLAVLIGWLVGRGIGWMFEKGYVPEFLKAPIVFAAVLATFVLTDEIGHETGLLAVTAIGVTLANMHIASINDMRHFKENISVLLISGIFIMLTASLSVDTLAKILDWRIIVFVLLMLFVVRPLSIFLSTIKSDLSTKEKILVGWIAPRGIVALTVSGYFAGVLTDAGFKDASILTSLTFALVFATVCVHGFSIGWIAKKLDLALSETPGVLLVGGNAFTTELAKVLKELKVPVLLTDASWYRLLSARKYELPVFRGEILSSHTEYEIDMTPYDYMLTMTEIDAYNALVCTTFIPEYGRNNVFQLSLNKQKEEGLDEIVHTVGGRLLFKEGITWEYLNDKIEEGYVIRQTSITEKYSFEQFKEERNEDTLYLFVFTKSKELHFFAEGTDVDVSDGDTLVSLGPAFNHYEEKKTTN